MDKFKKTDTTIIYCLFFPIKTASVFALTRFLLMSVKVLWKLKLYEEAIMICAGVVFFLCTIIPSSQLARRVIELANYAVKAGVVCWQVKLCDPHLAP